MNTFRWNLRSLGAALSLLVVASTACGQSESPRAHELFDYDWRFHLGDIRGAQEPALETASWRQLDLPHDWSAEGEFSTTNASCTGFLPGGVGWYRKLFTTDASWQGKKVFITFDGAYRNAEVWLNGHELGRRPYGYSSFEYGLTPFILTNGSNVLAVRVERENVADSRWYPGSGIYRHVWLTRTSPVHVPLWGNYVTTPRAGGDSADVVAHTEVTNETARAQSVRVTWQIETPDGGRLAEGSQREVVQAGASRTLSLWQKVASPKLWSPETPALYTMVTRVFAEGNLTDEVRTPFGIRTFYFDANRGFFLNGQNLKLKGVCLHHDGGVVGAAVPEEMLARRLKLVKDIGGNAIRCSHNPMAPELYDLCDRLGLLVLDEAFDEWELGKRKWVQGRNVGTAERFGYSAEFAAWAERDCADMVRRDRNHPSIILWSLGNEIDYPTDPYVLAETRSVEGFAQDARAPQQTLLTLVAPKLIAAVKRQDATRPVTMALANVVSSEATGLAQMLDIVGYNYQEQDYARDHQAFPTRVIYGSENGTGYAAWRAMAENPFISAQFLWVGFDFLGEADRWPNHGSQSGLFDTRGFKKTTAWRQQAMWSEAPMVAAAVAPSGAGGRGTRGAGLESHWTWPPNTGSARVVVFSNCERVELYLNESVVASRPVSADRSATFNLEYQPGELRAVGFRANLAVATNALTTAGAAAALRVEVEPSLVPANGRKVVQAVVSVVDARGNLVPTARNAITVEVEGAGRLLGVDNGDQNDPTELSSNTKRAKGGQVLVIVQAGCAAGSVTLKATAPDLPAATVVLPVKD